jgi:hypothetical protein
MNKILLYLGVLVLGFVIGWAGMMFFGDGLVSLFGGPYKLPSTLSYSSESGWKDINGEGWKLSVKESWNLQTPLGGSSILTNQREDEKTFTVIVFPMPQGKTLEEYMSDVEENLEQSKQFLSSFPAVGEPKLLNTQILTINDRDAGAIFLKMDMEKESFDIIAADVLIEKNSTIYLLLIATTDKFYKSNKKDIQTLIGSFK